MSLQTLVSGSLAGRLHPRRAAVIAEPTAVQVAVGFPGAMRFLETGLALLALATALLIGAGH